MVYEAEATRQQLILCKSHLRAWQGRSDWQNLQLMVAVCQALVLRCVQEGKMSVDDRDGHDVCRKLYTRNKREQNSTEIDWRGKKSRSNLHVAYPPRQSHSSLGGLDPVWQCVGQRLKEGELKCHGGLCRVSAFC